MKIAVQKQIIDTENIYSISEIYRQEPESNVFSIPVGSYYCFDIESFGAKLLNVSVFCLEDINGEQDKIIAQIGVPGVSVEALAEERKKVLAELPLKNKERIEKMRDEIVKIWSGNQPKIPMFDIKNY